MLSDKDIRVRIDNYNDLVIDPFDPGRVEPSSVDLILGDEFKRVERPESSSTNVSLSPSDDIITEEAGGLGDEDEDTDIVHVIEGGQSVVLEPGDLMLATTREHVEIPSDLSAQVLGRSTLGRLGVSVHQTAGFIDPGFKGQITLELSNNGPLGVELEPGLRVCQIVFNELSSDVEDTYGGSGSNYQNQTGATTSSLDFSK